MEFVESSSLLATLRLY